MSADLVERFRARLEILKGEVCVIRDLEEAGRVISEIVTRHEAACVALANLPDALRDGIAQGLEGTGVSILEAPFARKDLPGAIDEAQVGVSGAAFAIAQTGTVAEVATDDAHRLVSALPRVHVSFFRSSDLVGQLDEAAPLLRKTFQEHPENCAVSFISGPSRTGDIEMILTLGVHGPEIMYAVILDDEGSA